MVLRPLRACSSFCTFGEYWACSLVERLMGFRAFGFSGSRVWVRV